MDSRLRFLMLIALVPVLLLIAFMAGLLYSQWSTPPQVVVRPSATPAPTDPPTRTPTPTETPFVIAFPSPAPTATPTATRTPTATPTTTATPTQTRAPTSTRAPVRTSTPTPVPTPTEFGGQYRFRPEGVPTVFRGRSCQAQNIIFGWVKGRDGTGLPNVSIRFVPKYGRPPELPGITREAPDAGYYELTVGTAGNEWDIFLVDAGDQPMSQTVTFFLQQQESGDCWWLLNWIER